MKVFRKLFPRETLERDLDDELSFHVESRMRQHLEEGLSPRAAREEALRRFGDVDAVRAACRRIGLRRIRAERRSEMWDHLSKDVRFAVRSLRRRPGFSLVVTAILALGIGGAGAMFSLVDGVLLRPLPYPQPERLVLLWGTEEGLKTGSNWTSMPDFVDFEAATRAFAGMAAWSQGEAAVTAESLEPAQVPVARVAHDLLPTLGVHPALGRGILASEDRLGAEPVAVLSHGFWSRRFAADPEVLGRSLTVDGVDHRVVGVLPADLAFTDADLLLPLAHTHAGDDRGQHRLLVLARLADGVSLERAVEDVERVAALLEAAHPESNTGRGARLEPLHEAMVGDARPALHMLAGAVGLLLLIVCANVASLVLARATGRGREVALRRALGASRGRLLRLFLVEGLVLTALGGLLGVAVAAGGVELVRAAQAAGIPRLDAVRLDGRALGAIALLTLGTGVLFGLVPALQTSERRLQAALGQGGQGATATRRRPRLRKLLVVGEVALAVVLLAGAGLLAHSFLLLDRVDPGFTARDTLVVPIALPITRYPNEAWRETVAFYEQLQARLASHPETEAVAVAHQHPLAGGWETSFELPGVFERPVGERPEARIRPVRPGYFETVGIPLLAGRDFTDHDDADGAPVVIVNRAMAQRFFPGSDPVGRRLAKQHWWGYLSGEWEIVGVAGDVKMDGLASGTPWAMYFPHAQMPFNEMNLLLRTGGDPHALVPAVRRAVAELDPLLPVEGVTTLDAIRSDSLADRRFRSLLLAGFALLALALAAVGVYGVLAYTVARRTREIGIRMSFGADAGDVVGGVLREGLAMVAAGVVVGLGATLVLTRFLEGLLYGVDAGDPQTLAVAVAVLVASAVAACLVPALRATRVDPMQALRAE